MAENNSLSQAVKDKLPELAEFLIKKWNKKYADDAEKKNKIPNVGHLTSGLEHLIRIGELSLSDDFKPKEVFDEVKQAIDEAGGLLRWPSPNGFLNTEFLISLLNAAICPNQKDHDTTNVGRVTGDAPNKDLYTVRYFIDASVDEFIDRQSTTKLVADATQAWKQHTKFLIIDAVDDQADANVIVTMETIDGNGGTLGKAPVAGPGNFQGPLVIRMDKKEGWTANLFQAAVSHEFGHVLGLGHSDHSDQLMSPVIRNGIVTPQTEDVTRIQDIYQKSERATPQPAPVASGGVQI